MSIINDIFSRLLGRIPVRGTLTTPSGEEEFPIAVSNEIMGGPFIANNIDDLKELSVERLIKGCKCTVNQYTAGDVITPTRTYLCINVPNQKLSETGENVSDYWVLDRPQQENEGAVESQYSESYLGSRPPFQSSVITKEAYNAGYATTEDFESGDTERKIWKTDYDSIEHKWVRQRTGSLADWGMPVSLDGGYQEGNYADIRFQWRLKSLGKPARPSSSIEGKPNNLPDGWNDTPDIPDGEDYNTYILTNNLWRISATKGVYGDLLSEWTDPVQISTNPLLVRYGIDAYSDDYLNEVYWRPYYSPGDRFKASRVTESSDWIVERISEESGEYTDYVFKEFENSYEPTLDDSPTTVLGYGINGWRDSVFTVQDGYTLHVSTSRKFSDGTISEWWTLPVRYDGKNTIRSVIVPKNNTGHTFKNKQVGGETVITPESITLEAKLFEAVKRVDPEDITKVEWYRGSVESGTLIPKLPVGTEPNRNPVYGGINDTELTIFPENVDGNQEFSCRVIFRDEDYIDSIDAIDVTDGVGYQTIIDSDSGFTYKGVESKVFTAYLYENGLDISNSSNLTFEWFLGAPSIGTSRTVSVADTLVSGITALKLDITLQGVTYSRVESLTDISDGKSTERQYSKLESLDTSYNPDTPGNPGEFTTSSEDAIWAIERIEGESWGVAYRVKGEKGSPNGAFQKTVYRTRAPEITPPWLVQSPPANTNPDDPLTPTDWTEIPEADAATGSEIWASKATFQKNPSTEEVSEVVANWNISGVGWSTPFKLTQFPPAGDNGSPGTDGYNGWSPILSGQSDGDRRVLKLNEWTGGSGAKPGGEGFYLGVNGLESSIDNALDVRGAVGATGPKGADGVFESSDFWATSTKSYQGSDSNGSWNFQFRKDKMGMVHYNFRWYRKANSGGAWKNVTLSSFNDFIPKEAPNAGTTSPVLMSMTGANWEGQNSFPNSGASLYAGSAMITKSGSTYYVRVYLNPNWYSAISGTYVSTSASGW